MGFYRVQVVVSGQPLEKEYTLAVKPGPADIDSVWVMMVTHGEIGGDDITFKATACPFPSARFCCTLCFGGPSDSSLFCSIR